MYETRFLHQLDTLKEKGHYRHFLEVNKSAQHFPSFHYNDVAGITHSAINWCSNDYLGLSTQEEVIAKLGFITHRSGTGSSGTRNISGTTQHHLELEKTIAAWHHKDAALLFNGAYAANVTTLQTIGRHWPELIFISDERNHASLIEGMRSAGNKKIIFRHNDTEQLESILRSLPVDQPKMLVIESIYSIKGTIAPLKILAKLVKKYNALSYVDEVHAVGLYGQNGAGIIERENLQASFDIVNGTLSKAIGVYGGYIAASSIIIDFIRSFGTGFIFTTSLPPAVCSAANRSIAYIIENPPLREQFSNNVYLLRKALAAAEVPFLSNNSHITGIPVGDAIACRTIAQQLLQQQGIYLQPINFPTVPVGEECLRVIVTAKHQLKHINYLAHSLKKILTASGHLQKTAATSPFIEA